ncbi:IclR family transcriptional regulator [Sphingomonas sp. AOB5]|uniref:IclR family transcriptional regulator n=1 Tax=Sphingomonas sp. AOB5 TaxID=3034017 RepID=UPI0023F6321D|nr:IclR family transcriptional regulator [Sphingomonas sp. AOB5]MDF7775411.1 IclR family transcriptional regulator [Sphingomonas sp. AOB5]
MPQIRATSRTLAMLEAVIADGGRQSIAALARANGVPVATAHRQVATLVGEGYLALSGDGRHLPGPRLLGLLHRLDEKQVIASVAAPLLDELARDLRCTVQLGTFENEMVTYRIKTGSGADGLFTRVGMQLEAYCSAIGKVLLAHLPGGERSGYLANGPFVPLTPRTIVDPGELAGELAKVRAQGFAIDDGEIDEGLICLAVPVRNPEARVPAAISVSQIEGDPARVPHERLLPALRETADAIERAAFG